MEEVERLETTEEAEDGMRFVAVELLVSADTNVSFEGRRCPRPVVIFGCDS